MIEYILGAPQFGELHPYFHHNVSVLHDKDRLDFANMATAWLYSYRVRPFQPQGSLPLPLFLPFLLLRRRENLSIRDFRPSAAGPDTPPPTRPMTRREIADHNERVMRRRVREGADPSDPWALEDYGSEFGEEEGREEREDDDEEDEEDGGDEEAEDVEMTTYQSSSINYERLAEVYRSFGSEYHPPESTGRERPKKRTGGYRQGRIATPVVLLPKKDGEG